MHECKLHMQAPACVCTNIDSGSLFDIFKHALIKTHPKHIPTPSKVLGFHLNPSLNKIQAFTFPKID